MGFRNSCIAVLILLLSFVFVIEAGADTLYLKNGRTMEGIIKSESQDSIDLEVFGGVVRFKRSEVGRVEKTDAQASEAIRQKWEKKRVETYRKAKEEQLRKEFEPKNVEIIQQGGQIVVDCLLNKKANVTLIMDTGASFVVLTSNAAKKLGLSLDNTKEGTLEMILADGSKVSARRVILESVSAQGVEAKNVQAVVLPEASDTANLKDGLLGMSFLKNFNFKVDQKNNKLVLEKI